MTISVEATIKYSVLVSDLLGALDDKVASHIKGAMTSLHQFGLCQAMEMAKARKYHDWNLANTDRLGLRLKNLLLLSPLTWLGYIHLHEDCPNCG